MTKRRSGGRSSHGAAGAGRREGRVASEVQRILSLRLLEQARDPRVSHVTITRVRLTPDLRLARVYFTLLEVGAGDRKAALAGLESAVPFLRRALAEELDLRYTPDLVFAYDDDLVGARRIDSLLRGLRAEREAADREEEAEDGEGGDDDAPGASDRDRGDDEDG